jgi:metal-responsive CopG/Arc/MetJ family transcriptional regulator
MDWLLTIELEESVVEKIDKTAKRMGKTRMEVANQIIKYILKNLEAEKSNENFDRQTDIFDNSKSDTNH